MSENHEHFGLHLGFEIAKLLMKGAMIGAAVCIAKELHKVHKAVENHKH